MPRPTSHQSYLWHEWPFYKYADYSDSYKNDQICFIFKWANFKVKPFACWWCGCCITYVKRVHKLISFRLANADLGSIILLTDTNLKFLIILCIIYLIHFIIIRKRSVASFWLIFNDLESMSSMYKVKCMSIYVAKW